LFFGISKIHLTKTNLINSDLPPLANLAKYTPELKICPLSFFPSQCKLYSPGGKFLSGSLRFLSDFISPLIIGVNDVAIDAIESL